MKTSRAKDKSGYRNPLCYGGLFLIAGVTFLTLSRVVVSITDTPAPNPLKAAAPATPNPDSSAPPASDNSPANPARNPTMGLSGILLMFSVTCFLLTGVCVGWLVQIYRKSRPAWKTQTRYPVHKAH